MTMKVVPVPVPILIEYVPQLAPCYSNCPIINTNIDGDVWTLLLSFRLFNTNDSLSGGNNTKLGTSIDTTFLDDTLLVTVGFSLLPFLLSLLDKQPSHVDAT